MAHSGQACVGVPHHKETDHQKRPRLVRNGMSSSAMPSGSASRRGLLGACLALLVPPSDLPPCNEISDTLHSALVRVSPFFSSLRKLATPATVPLLPSDKYCSSAVPRSPPSAQKTGRTP